jgi:hypothetical protein
VCFVAMNDTQNVKRNLSHPAPLIFFFATNNDSESATPSSHQRDKHHRIIASKKRYKNANINGERERERERERGPLSSSPFFLQQQQNWLLVHCSYQCMWIVTRCLCTVPVRLLVGTLGCCWLRQQFQLTMQRALVVAQYWD